MDEQNELPMRRMSPDTLTEPTQGFACSSRRPRIAFLGLGWIGLLRLRSAAMSGTAEIVALSDSSEEARRSAAVHAPGALVVSELEALRPLGLDGIVIATPTALHADQVVSCLNSGMAVFCQKPLGRTAAETAKVIKAARAADRLLAIDMCYRLVRSMGKVKELVQAGAIGEVYACDLVFHNAYGPDRPWYRDPKLSGGGCVIDLGIHLVDLVLWTLRFPRVESVTSRRFASGRALTAGDPRQEDFAVARIDLINGATANLSCSWNLPAGRDAIIRAAFFGTDGGLAVKNIAGSFYDFRAERYTGTATVIVDQPPDPWGGRALESWIQRLSVTPQYDPAVEETEKVAAVLDSIYGREPTINSD
jgi:predicted dehydrogenase